MTAQAACAADRHDECDLMDFIGPWCGCSCHDDEEQASPLDRPTPALIGGGRVTCRVRALNPQP
jgi:hypothetical protein